MNTRIYHGDSLEVLPTIKRNEVDLVITSPPYNIGMSYISYDDNKSYEDYLLDMTKIFAQCYDVMKDDARLCLNIPTTKQVPVRKSLYIDLGNLLQDIGFIYRDDIVWYKQTIHRRTAWGSWASSSDPYLVRPYETILIFHKQKKKKETWVSDITADEFKMWTNSLWEIPPESKLSKRHPAVFPEELPKRLMKFYGSPGDVVLDPFVGSGTTSRVARQLGRSSIGIEIDDQYVGLALSRTFGEDSYQISSDKNYTLYHRRDE